MIILFFISFTDIRVERYAYFDDIVIVSVIDSEKNFDLLSGEAQ